jgi:RNA polymerase sigma-70 factor (ECF subfamily)
VKRQKRHPIRLQDAEHEEFEELYHSHYRLVQGFFRRRGLTDEDCHDLTHDTFLSAYRGYHQYRGEASPKTWLLTIAGHLWLNRLRDRSAAKRSSPEIPLDGWTDGGEALLAQESFIDGPEDPLHEMLDTERQQLLYRAVETLPPQMRRCFMLYFYQGRKYREIAELLGISIETVKSQIHQAKDKLRQYMQTRGVSPPMSVGGEPP